MWMDLTKEGASEDRTKYSRQKTGMRKGSGIEMSMACLNDSKEVLLYRLETSI